MNTINRQYLWLLLPLALILPAALLLRGDLGHFLVWWLALSLAGWIAWPLAARLFPGGDQGYLLAKPLGLALGAFILWTLSYLHILPFRRWSIILVFCALLFMAWFWKNGWRKLRHASQEPGLIRRAAAGELLFGAGLLVWTFARGLKPELDNLEKFMDLGFMNTLWRTSYLPAADMWLAGGKINYYYFGQYLYTFVAKLTAIRPEVSYNLSMATTFAMTLVLGYAVVSSLLSLARQKDSRLPAGATVAGGLVGGILLAVGGNGQSFLYDQSSLGHNLLLWLFRHGLVGGDPNQTFWFADSTRFIGYNPDTADKTIHEFPYYSFLVADLHAHVVNLAVVLLLLAVLVRLIEHGGLLKSAADLREEQLRPQPLDDQQWYRLAIGQLWRRFRATAINAPVLCVTLLLSLSMMGNYWDFAIYFLVASLVLFLVNIRGYGKIGQFSSLLIFFVQMALILIPYLAFSQPALTVAGLLAAVVLNQYLTIVRGDALTLTGAQMSWVFFLAHFFTLPFSWSFEPISKTVALALNHTPLWQLVVLWGPAIMAGVLLAVYLLASHQPGGRLRRIFPPAESDRTAAVLPGGPLRRALLLMNPADLMALTFFLGALFLLLVPEIVYVVDIYSGDYKRANTMFKFTYQAFVLLSLVWAYAVARVNAAWIGARRRRRQISGAPFGQLRNRSDRTWPAQVIGSVLAVSLIIPFWYPIASTTLWLGPISVQRYQGLDGLAPFGLKDSAQIPGYSENELAPDVAAIKWLNSHVSGQPVILETFGESYTDFCRISVFTGLPTVLGWETHEWLWRTSKVNKNAYGTVVLPRQEDIRLMYTTTDQVVRQDLLKKYQVAYVVIGDLERAKFSEKTSDTETRSLVQEDLLLELGTVVFQAQTLVIIQLN